MAIEQIVLNKDQTKLFLSFFVEDAIRIIKEDESNEDSLVDFKNNNDS